MKQSIRYRLIFVLTLSVLLLAQSSAEARRGGRGGFLRNLFGRRAMGGMRRGGGDGGGGFGFPHAGFGNGLVSLHGDLFNPNGQWGGQGGWSPYGQPYGQGGPWQQQQQWQPGGGQWQQPGAGQWQQGTGQWGQQGGPKGSAEFGGEIPGAEVSIPYNSKYTPSPYQLLPAGKNGNPSLEIMLENSRCLANQVAKQGETCVLAMAPHCLNASVARQGQGIIEVDTYDFGKIKAAFITHPSYSPPVSGPGGNGGHPSNDIALLTFKGEPCKRAENVPTIPFRSTPAQPGEAVGWASRAHQQLFRGQTIGRQNIRSYGSQTWAANDVISMQVTEPRLGYDGIRGGDSGGGLFSLGPDGHPQYLLGVLSTGDTSGPYGSATVSRRANYNIQTGWAAAQVEQILSQTRPRDSI